MARIIAAKTQKQDPMKAIASMLKDKKNEHVLAQLKELLLSGDLETEEGDESPATGKDAKPKQKNTTQAQNHPRKGDVLKAHPIRKQADINKIKRLLAGDTRNFGLFVCGVNSALRASDLTRLRVGDVRHLEVGEHFMLREKKKGKIRNVTINQPMRDAIDAMLAEMPGAKDTDYLFPSQKGGGPLNTSSLHNLVKEWCRMVKLKGNFGSHSLRKTWGYHARVTFGMDLATLVDCFGHSTQKQTLTYLCIQEEEVRAAFLNEL
ncbi:MAG: tyrosine-type recombinase/integrase [Geobacteraceae bacterium]